MSGRHFRKDLGSKKESPGMLRIRLVRDSSSTSVRRLIALYWRKVRARIAAAQCRCGAFAG